MKRKRRNQQNIPENMPINASTFSGIPTKVLCESIQFLINILRNRGCQIYDFDSQEKVVQNIMIIRGKIYFLAAKEGDEDGEI